MRRKIGGGGGNVCIWRLYCPEGNGREVEEAEEAEAAKRVETDAKVALVYAAAI